MAIDYTKYTAGELLDALQLFQVQIPPALNLARRMVHDEGDGDDHLPKRSRLIPALQAMKTLDQILTTIDRSREPADND